MSTRCQIRVEESAVLLYKHSDGYPKEVLPILLPFVANFMAKRGPDPEYMSARLLQTLMNQSDQYLIDMSGKYPHAISGSSLLIGFGVGTETHGDIEYFYDILADGTVIVWKMTFGSDHQKEVARFPLGTKAESALALINKL
jgi:hypothetical protein